MWSQKKVFRDCFYYNKAVNGLYYGDLLAKLRKAEISKQVIARTIQLYLLQIMVHSNDTQIVRLQLPI